MSQLGAWDESPPVSPTSESESATAGWIASCLVAGTVGLVPIYVGAVFTQPAAVFRVGMTALVLVLVPALVTSLLPLIPREPEREGSGRLWRRALASASCGIVVLPWSLVLGALIPSFATFTSLSVFVGVAVVLFAPFLSTSLITRGRTAMLVNTVYALAAILFLLLALAGIGV